MTASDAIDMLTVEGNMNYFYEHGEPSVDELKDALCRVDRVYGPHLLIYLWGEGLLTTDALRATIGDVWSMAEYPDVALPRETWRDLFSEAGYTVDGKPAQRPSSPLHLYRGAVRSPAHRRRDWSWTDSLEVARFFAKGPRGRQPGVVWTATVAPWRLLARNADPQTTRGESEYVVDTRHLRILMLEDSTTK